MTRQKEVRASGVLGCKTTCLLNQWTHCSMAMGRPQRLSLCKALLKNLRESTVKLRKNKMCKEGQKIILDCLTMPVTNDNPDLKLTLSPLY